VPLLYRVKQSHHYAVVGLEILLKLTHRFFVLSPRDARYALVTLAIHTGWALSELLELNGHELMQWLDVLPRVPAS
jgi:hypothetical protein